MAARGRQRGRGGNATIGVLAGWQVYEGNVHTYLGPLYDAFAEAALQRRCNLLLAFGIGRGESFMRPAWLSDAPSTDFVPVGPWNTDGLIAITPLANEDRSSELRHIAAGGHPVVFVGAGEGGPSVIVDNRGGIDAAIQHLVEHGHRRIAYIGTPPTEPTGDGYERLLAYHDAVKRFSLDDDPALVEFGGNIIHGGHAIARLLESGVSFTALLTTNDEVAAGAMEALRHANLRTPEDVAVIGFDDRPESATLLPPLTTVRHRPADIAEAALNLVLERIAGDSASEHRQVPTSLRVRESCGCREDLWLPSAPELREGDPDVLERELILAMQAVISEEIGPDDAEALTLCETLGHELRLALESRPPTARRSSLREIVLAFPDLHREVIWYGILGILDERIAGLAVALGRPRDDPTAQALVQETRLLLAESMRRRFFELAWERNRIADRIRLMADRLVGAEHEGEVAEIVQRHLPLFGIESLAVVLLEPNTDDPYGFARRLETRPDVRSIARQFPEGLLETTEPYRLTLFPLHLADGHGFVASDSRDFETCTLIARSISAALRSIALRRESARDRRVAEEAERITTDFLESARDDLEATLEHMGEGLDHVEAATRSVGGLIGEALELTTRKHPDAALDLAPVDVGVLLEEVALIAQPLADSGLRVSVAPAESDLVALANEDRLRRAVLYLIRQATSGRTKGKVALRAHRDGGRIVVDIATSSLAAAPFLGAVRPASEPLPGLSLELAISRRLIELHGGKLETQAPAAGGTSFSFSLPLVEDDPARAAQGAPAPARVPTVLIVEADAETLEFYARVISTALAPSRTIRARNAEGAIAMLANEPVDLVLLDLSLPDIAGPSFFWEKQQLPHVRSTPVIAISSNLHDISAASAFADELAAVLPRDLFSAAEIGQIVQRVLVDVAHPPAAQQIVNRATAFIHAHCSQPLTRTEIAAHVSTSGGYLSRCFDRQLGISPMSYLLRYRLSLAKILLAETGRHVTAIAHEVGFSDHAYFSRAFRREVGVSPTAFRAQSGDAALSS
ncbi:MAG: hypothetical protein QOH73_870 [Gaiellaceae bacterium]|nr:hypothetical protein [Gaiellaceae bacterium]